jgi:hypothetical protein
MDGRSRTAGCCNYGRAATNGIATFSAIPYHRTHIDVALAVVIRRDVVDQG